MMEHSRVLQTLIPCWLRAYLGSELGAAQQGNRRQ
jgi:hypothetical protein